MIDRERVREIVELLKNSSSVELALRDGDTYVRARRMPKVAGRAEGAEAAARAPDALPEPDASAPAPGDVIIAARLVGRFYHGKGAGQPPVVKIGDGVEVDQIVATIEALGKITGVASPEAGDVIEFLADDGRPVGYGTPLIRLRKRQE